MCNYYAHMGHPTALCGEAIAPRGHVPQLAWRPYGPWWYRTNLACERDDPLSVCHHGWSGRPRARGLTRLLYGQQLRLLMQGGLGGPRVSPRPPPFGARGPLSIPL